MIGRRRALLGFAAFLVGTSYTIAVPDTSTYSAAPGTAISAPVVRGERAVLAPVTESRTVPMAAVFGILLVATVVAAAFAGSFLRRLPSPRHCRVALRIPRLRGPPTHSSS